MNPIFQEVLDDLEPKFKELINSNPVTYSQLPSVMPKRGIYLFSEGDRHLYVGRTNRLRQRLSGHCSPSSTHLSAAFAFRIARLETGQLRASYKKEGSRAMPMQDATFATSFQQAKQRLSR